MSYGGFGGFSGGGDYSGYGGYSRRRGGFPPYGARYGSYDAPKEDEEPEKVENSFLILFNFDWEELVREARESDKGMTSALNKLKKAYHTMARSPLHYLEHVFGTHACKSHLFAEPPPPS